MPRITAQHEQEVRARIVRAANDVFGSLGYHRATMRDVVAASGLSVGAIYTYFGSKDELFLACCDLTADEVGGAIAARLAQGTTTRERLHIALGFYLDSLDGTAGVVADPAVLIHAWAEAEQEPAIREMLGRRREQISTIGRMLLAEGLAHGEVPAWADIDALAVAFGAMLDGLSLVRLESGSRYRRADAERQAGALIELLLAATAADRPISPGAVLAPYAPPAGVG
ncbi:MAG TPA: TetR/AcrR family transcriptional regulator [Candidatus Limnocylindrales bacterium]